MIGLSGCRGRGARMRPPTYAHIELRHLSIRPLAYYIHSIPSTSFGFYCFSSRSTAKCNWTHWTSRSNRSAEGNRNRTNWTARTWVFPRHSNYGRNLTLRVNVSTYCCGWFSATRSCRQTWYRSDANQHVLSPGYSWSTRVRSRRLLSQYGVCS